MWGQTGYGGTQEMLVSGILSQLGLDDTHVSLTTLSMVPYELPKIIEARAAYSPLLPLSSTLVQRLQQLAACGKLRRYHVEKAIETAYQARQAANLRFDRTEEVFAKELDGHP